VFDRPKAPITVAQVTATLAALRGEAGEPGLSPTEEVPTEPEAPTGEAVRRTMEALESEKFPVPDGPLTRAIEARIAEEADWQGYHAKTTEERADARGHFREGVLRRGGLGHLLRPAEAVG